MPAGFTRHGCSFWCLYSQNPFSINIHAGYSAAGKALCVMTALPIAGHLCDQKPWLASYSSWCVRDICESHRCIHGVCIPGLGDLRHLVLRPEFSVNKFQKYQSLVLECLEEWFWNRTASGLDGSILNYYRNLPFVKHESSHEHPVASWNWL